MKPAHVALAFALGVPEARIYAALAGKNLVGPSGQVEVGRERIHILPER